MKKLVIMAAGLLFIAGANATQAKPVSAHQLPPGLEKKAKRTGELPPGWQKKLAVGRELDVEVVAHAEVVIPLGADGALTIEVEGRVIKLVETTREILEIIQ